MARSPNDFSKSHATAALLTPPQGVHGGMFGRVRAVDPCAGPCKSGLPPDDPEHALRTSHAPARGGSVGFDVHLGDRGGTLLPRASPIRRKSMQGKIQPTFSKNDGTLFQLFLNYQPQQPPPGHRVACLGVYLRQFRAFLFLVFFFRPF